MRGRQPFAGEPRAFVVLPESDPTLGGELELLELEHAEFEAELGTRVELASVDPGVGARWQLVIDEHQDMPPRTEVAAEVATDRLARRRRRRSLRGDEPPAHCGSSR